MRVGHESMAIDDDALASIRAHGSVGELNTDGVARRLVRVSSDEITVYAYFSELPREAGFVPELAAYRFDRMLRLGMVPVTIRREIGGQEGTLQFVPAETMSERERVTDEERGGAPCSFEKQMGAMYVFDALIQNPARTPSSMLYSRDDWLLMLVDHENSFSVEKGRPAYLKDVELAIGDQWRMILLELDKKVLRAKLGDVLDEHRLAALSDRRDALVKDSLQFIGVLK